MQDNPLILNDDLKKNETITNSIHSSNFGYLLKYIIIGDSNVRKTDILLRFTNGLFKS